MVKEKYLPFQEPAPEGPPAPKTFKDKLENFWYYHKLKVFLGLFLVVVALLFYRVMFSPLMPDYTVGLMTDREWSEEEIKMLEAYLRPYAQDLNADSVPYVDVVIYNPDRPQEDIRLFLTDESHALSHGIGDKVFSMVDKELTTVKDWSNIKLQDVTVDWKTCDAIKKNPNFTDKLYFAIRANELPVGEDLMYAYDVEFFFRLTMNEPFDKDLLHQLLDALATESK